MIISFAKTTGALLAGEKCVTRREWTGAHAAHFKAGMLIDAWDRSPRTGKGKKVATIRIMRDPYRDMSDALHPFEYRHEGFVWMNDHGLSNVVDATIADWSANPRMVWVVEFELVEVVA